MYLDFKELLAISSAKKVKYLVAGGYAVPFQALPRAPSFTRLRRFGRTIILATQ